MTIANMDELEISILRKALVAGCMSNNSYQAINKYNTIICLSEVQYVMKMKDK